MGDLISRHDAIHLAEQGQIQGFEWQFKKLCELPSAERKKGKWVEFPNHMAYKCSECGRIIQSTDGRRNVSKHYPFCHCGADMREGQDDDK